MKNFRWAVLAVVFAASGFLSFAAARHGLAEYWAGSPNADDWVRAAQLEPSNTENWYRLGRYRQFDFQNGDLQQAIAYYRKATAAAPMVPRYWLDLASAYESAGNSDAAEMAYQAAQRDYPISAEVAWGYGNFLLRQNRTDEAFSQIQHAVAEDPALATLAVSTCWRSTQDVNRILNLALPQTAEAAWGAVDFFTGQYQPLPAMAAWRRVAASPAPAPFALTRVSPLLDLLLQAGDAEDARTVWRQALSATGTAAPPDSAGSLIWDGGFEGDFLNEGFSWRYSPVQGAMLRLDEGTFHSGRRALQITFDGSANLDFQQMKQYVEVRPQTVYRFSAFIHTQDLTSDQGIHFEIDDPAHPGTLHAGTLGVIGTQPWQAYTAEFTTGPQTQLLRITLRRNTSNLLANKIKGTVWVDDVSLVPEALSTR